MGYPLALAMSSTRTSSNDDAYESAAAASLSASATGTYAEPAGHSDWRSRPISMSRFGGLAMAVSGGAQGVAGEAAQDDAVDAFGAVEGDEVEAAT